MDEISSKLELLQLQEKKASLMQQDIEIDEVLLASKQKLDNLMNTKKDLDNEDDELTAQFSKLSEELVKHHR